MKGSHCSHCIFVVIVQLCTLFLPSCCQNVSTNEIDTNFDSFAEDFNTFRKHFHRIYEVNSEEYHRRHVYYQNSKQRHTYLQTFSSTLQSAKYGINKFSDLSQKEFKDIYLQAAADRAPPYSGLKTKGLPAKFDWREKAVVAPVQDQQTCGSCWAFSVVGAVQSVYAISGSPLTQISVQQVVDCSYRNKGCSGGSPVRALNWMKQTKVKLVPQKEYPYKAKTGLCHFFSQSHGGVSVKNFTAHDFRVPRAAEKGGGLVLCNDRAQCLLSKHGFLRSTEVLYSGQNGQEEAMMGQLVKNGPLAAIVDAVSWQDYLGGIIQHHCSSQWSNHAVLVVGYDTMGDIPYWIVQNSWGTTWGNKGYVYIRIGGNVCGIADSVAAVVL